MRERMRERMRETTGAASVMRRHSHGAPLAALLQRHASGSVLHAACFMWRELGGVLHAACFIRHSFFRPLLAALIFLSLLRRSSRRFFRLHPVERSGSARGIRLHTASVSLRHGILHRSIDPNMIKYIQSVRLPHYQYTSRLEIICKPKARLPLYIRCE